MLDSGCRGWAGRQRAGCATLFAQLAQRAERRPKLFGEQLRLLPGGQVAGPVDLAVADEGGVLLFHPAARGPEDLAGKTVKATGSVTAGGVLPAAAASARVASGPETLRALARNAGQAIRPKTRSC